ncbi:small subunit rRNA maturation protein TSR4 Ecym_1336 [Eremothecium cymbalariae DBVPG|uniref:Programmed cell death protein 2 C-terminal domain-containing protein n=1 Tax=Eremothecium cymbalariae (strain CBS 270.75 / DBVPG 7215 / KCTC 17166 / NRRL Y-17582) TaxID=931890 RepID=G8JNA6_ERECY|nr:hypothetical protein Ecym_1336 [Eremothecium cymbalariae DBVPG\
MSSVEELISDGEEECGTEQTSQVYLGFVDTAIRESDEVSVEESFIGGEPVWLHADSRPDEKLLSCKACKSVENMKLLLQAFAPLDSQQVYEVCERSGIVLSTEEFIRDSDDRVLYVFICSKCARKAGSIVCIRGVRRRSSDPSRGAPKQVAADAGRSDTVDEEKEVENNNNPFASVGFGTFGNPFNQDAEKNPFMKKDSSGDAKVVVSEQEMKPSTARKLHDAQPYKKFDKEVAFPGFFLYVEGESFKGRVPDHLKLPKNLKIDKNALELSADEDELKNGPIKLDPRTEKLSKFLDDDVFQKFQEVVGYNPLQVLRYNYGGKPLYYARTAKKFEDVVAAPSANPSSRRIYEMQLMPKMIMDLEDEISIESGMEWGTIMIFTDVENYVTEFDKNNVGYMEESVVVQWETS